jgi:S-methylmethionine-dependent homocysteine/selenocysteine methylase
MVRFPESLDGMLYLTEGGQETEILYRHGHDLPEFAAFPLLDRPAALADLRTMYERYLETAERHGFAALMGGMDYRASPDWGARLGYSRAGLAEMQLRAIEFLREVARPFASRLPGVLVTGIVGPRGDAYALDRTMTSSEAEDYHGVQMETLARARVDLVSAMTFNAVPEAVGVVRAAAGARLPLAVYFTLDGAGRLPSGPSLREAIEEVDAQTGNARPGFYGINCSHPVEFAPALEPGGWIRRLRALRPNAVRMEKVQLCQIGHLEDGDPRELGAQMGALAARHPHLDVWGGCCGTWDRHLDAIARNVRQARRPA